jgi:O-antigen ligase
MLPILALFVVALVIALGFHGPGHSLPLLLYASVALGLAALLSLHRAITRPTSLGNERTLLFAFLGYVAWLVICVQTSVSVESSFHPFWNLLALPLAYVTVRVLSDEPVWRTGVLLSLAGIAGASALWALGALVVSGERSAGPLSDPNNLAAFLNMAFFLVLGWRLGDRGHAAREHGLDALLVVLVLGLFATVSRTGIAIWFVAGALVILGVWRLETPKRPFALACAGALAGFALLYFARGSTTERFVSEISYAAGMDVRLAMWKASFEIFLDHPWFGAGLQTFRLLYPQYRSFTDQTSAGNFTHNDYFQFLGDGGVVLLACLLALVAWVVVCAARRIRAIAQGDEPRENWLGLGALVGMTTVFVHAGLNFSLYVLSLSILMGAVLALGVPRTGRAPLMTRPIGYAALGGVALAFLGGWFYLAVDAYASVLFQKQPGMPFVDAAVDAERMEIAADRLDALNPRRGLPMYALATVAARDADMSVPGLVRRANEYYEEAIARDPLNPRVYLDYGIFLKSQGRNDAAEEVLERAVEVDPTDLRILISLSNLYLSEGRTREAYRHFKERIWPWTRLFYYRQPDGVAFYLEKFAPLEREFGDGSLRKEIAFWWDLLVKAGHLNEAEREHPASR